MNKALTTTLSNDAGKEEVKMENPNDTWRPGHNCNREGIDSPFTGEWDFVEEGNLVCHLAQTAAFRVVNPMVHLQMWMVNRVYKLAQEYLPEDKVKEFYWYWRWASDLQTDIEVRMCEAAALVTQNLPDKLTSLNEMLDSAMVESGFCCHPNLAAYIHDAVTSHTIAEMEQTIPDFKREWLSPKGPHAPLETTEP